MDFPKGAVTSVNREKGNQAMFCHVMLVCVIRRISPTPSPIPPGHSPPTCLIFANSPGSWGFPWGMGEGGGFAPPLPRGRTSGAPKEGGAPIFEPVKTGFFEDFLA